jgi:hypothetical protein
MNRSSSWGGSSTSSSSSSGMIAVDRARISEDSGTARANDEGPDHHPDNHQSGSTTAMMMTRSRSAGFVRSIRFNTYIVTISIQVIT